MGEIGERQMDSPKNLREPIKNHVFDKCESPLVKSTGRSACSLDIP